MQGVDKPCGFKLKRGIDRPSTDVMGLDYQNRPKVWRVYIRNNRKGEKNDEARERRRAVSLLVGIRLYGNLLREERS